MCASCVGEPADLVVERQVLRAVDDDEIGFAAAGSHDADIAVFEEFVERALVLLDAIHSVEKDAGFLREDKSPTDYDAVLFELVVPAFDAEDGKRNGDGEQQDEWKQH